MDILIYDLDSRQTDIYDLVSSHLKLDFKKAFSKAEFFYEYEKDSRDRLVIINITEPIGEEIFDTITLKNPKQRILVVSQSLTYSHSFTCKECAEKFNRKLLLKPLNVFELLNHISNFDELLCKFSAESNEIREIMAEILKQFVYYTYEQKTKRIIKKDYSTNCLRELVAITELLNVHNIKYKLEDENIKLYF